MRELCTCEIVMRTGETLDSSLGDRPCSDISRIQLCPMHTATSEMHEALQQLVTYLREEVPDESLGTWEPVFKAQAALARAEGRQV